MKTFIHHAPIVALLLLIIPCVAQTKKGNLRPGKLYEAGEILFAPRYGFTATVPDGWEGMLPRESEVFLLTSTTTTYGEIYVFAREQGSFNEMQTNWKQGFSLSESIQLKALSPSVTDGLMSSEVTGEGTAINKGYKGFVIARCSESGPCVTTLLIAPMQFFESVKASALAFMKSSSFQPPSQASPYEDFNWQEFLTNKALMTYQEVQGGKKENYVHLCSDGTFTADLRKSGIFKNQNPQYRGKQKGTWSVSGNGPKTTIRFVFVGMKLPSAEVELTISDEKVYANGERYFVGFSEICER